MRAYFFDISKGFRSLNKNPAEIFSSGISLFNLKNDLFGLIFEIIKIGIVIDYTVC